MNESQWLACEDPERMLACLAPAMEDVRRRHGIAGPVGKISDRQLRLWVAAMRDHGGRKYAPVMWASQWRNGEAGANEVPGAAMTVARRWCDRQYNSPDDPPMATRCALLREIVGNPFRPMPRWLPCPECAARSKRGGYRTQGLTRCGTCDQSGTLNNPWLTPAVLALAQAAYDDRRADGTLDPVTLGWLADALEEAGCQDAAVLHHLRGQDGRKLKCPGRCQALQAPASEPRRYAVWISAGPESHWKECACCGGTGHAIEPVTHVRGCWATDLVLGKE